jgi:predicted transcriptional regulator of viral defense system
VRNESLNYSSNRYTPQLAKLAARQHGVVSAAQLAGLGLPTDAVTYRVKAGGLHRVHRGVYAVGHAKLSERGRYMAAVLAAGDGAVLASLSAAVLWRAWRRAAPEIHVLAPRRRRPQPGFRLRTTRGWHPRDVTVHDGIPVTTMARTLVDLTDVLTAPQLANVIHEAAYRNRFDAQSTRAAMARANGRRNLTRLERALTMNADGSAGTRSELEDRFLAIIREAGLPEPAINQRIGGIEVDFHWPGLVVEVDGHGHARPRTRAEDRRRDRELGSRGYEIVRLAGDELEAVVPLLTAHR